MFGNLGAFVNGNMFAGLFGADVGVKVAPTTLSSSRRAGGRSDPKPRPAKKAMTRAASSRTSQ